MESSLTLVDLHGGSSLYHNPLPQPIVSAALVGPPDGRRHFIAGERQRPFLVKEQIRPRHRRDPIEFVPFMQSFLQRNTSLAQNSGQIAERENDSRSGLVMIRQKSGSFVRPG